MKKLAYKTFILSSILFSCISCSLAPGSYPHVELYEFHTSETTLINAINKFKAENTRYCIPEQLRFKDGRKKEGGYWYHIWFYYPKEKQIIKCWTRESFEGNAQLGFVGIGDSPLLDNYKEINNDFSKKINKLQKEKFERLILNKIKKSLKYAL